MASPSIALLWKVTAAGVPASWQRLVVHTQPTYAISRRAYTFAVLEQLQHGLKRHDVFVSPSQKWGDPRAKLLRPAAWEAVRPQVCRCLGRSTDVAAELAALRQQLDVSYRRTAENLATNLFVRVEREGGKDTLTISPLVKLDTPPSLALLRAAVAGQLPLADLPDVILEVHHWTGFLDDFTHINESTMRVVSLATRYLRTGLVGNGPTALPARRRAGLCPCGRVRGVVVLVRVSARRHIECCEQSETIEEQFPVLISTGCNRQSTGVTGGLPWPG
jgi:hypothetical protein